ncbi:uncharacterized protein LOC125240929 [Leguminivora glycinivorella]|uniref:uncharacterized protein LOC125240929 n=1 Tax=Leguminivora glycinivorella TaxID=1035111 RepID=UPI00200FCB4E|nr:uncharacterized protein LOC125240929 [Leguminivora glycinivorella]
MSNETNEQTCQLLNNEIKALQSQCKELCYIIDNIEPLDIRTINSHNVNEKMLCSIESLAKHIQNEETPIITDSNVNTSTFLTELKDKIVQVEELTAFTAGAVQDVYNENNRLKASIKIVQEAKSRPWAGRRAVQPDHLQHAKQRFRTMKTELLGLIHSLFPGASDAIMGVLAELMKEKMDQTSSGYIQVTPENYHLMELLKDKNITSANPYNKMEVKLAF